MRLTGAKIYQTDAGRFADGDLHIDGDTIVDRTPGTDVLDLTGLHLLPGFIDCHVHIAVDTTAPDPDHLWHNARPGDIALQAYVNAARMLEAGFTTARDVGGWDYHEIAVRDAVASGLLIGPRLLCSGKILSITSATTPYYRGMYDEADGAAEVRKVARRQFAAGADHLKLLATGAMTSSPHERADAIQFRPDEIEEAVAIATNNHTYVAAHAHADAGIRNAVQAGVRSIEHGTFASDETLAIMAERGTFLVPTTCTTPALLNDAAVSQRVPEHIRRRYIEAHDHQISVVRRAREIGVRVAFGTDAGTPGNHFGDNMQELQVMVDEAGFSEQEAIAAATTTAAELLGLGDTIGGLGPGMTADIIGVRSDPLADIQAMRSVEFVMKGGAVVVGP